MIPPLNELGYLPAGVHPATLAEVEARFGQGSELRRVQMESIKWMVELAIKAGVRRIVLNGSFVTDIIEPNDVDCVLLGADPTIDPDVEDELESGLPFLEILLVGESAFNRLVDVTFASDRLGRPKGMIEVTAWN
jgi:Family of unknown function (DUF6932)